MARSYDCTCKNFQQCFEQVKKAEERKTKLLSAYLAKSGCLFWTSVYALFVRHGSTGMMRLPPQINPDSTITQHNAFASQVDALGRESIWHTTTDMRHIARPASMTATAMDACMTTDTQDLAPSSADTTLYMVQTDSTVQLDITTF
jgi:hypothetical protein